MKTLKPVTKKLYNYKKAFEGAIADIRKSAEIFGVYVIQDDDEYVTETFEVWSDGVYYKGQKVEKWK